MTESANAGELPITALVADAVTRIAPDATLLDVADALSAGDIGVLVVGDATSVKAVVSERDLVRSMAARRDPGATLVLEIANRDLIWCDATATVGEVALKMMDRYVRHLLVEEDGRLVGIVSGRDLLGAYATADLDPADDSW